MVLVRGGRVMAARPDGRVLWQSEAFSARYLGDVTDLNGDGRRDVIARSARDVRIFDALTGVERWRIPAGAIGPDRPELLGVQRLIIGGRGRRRPARRAGGRRRVRQQRRHGRERVL